MNTASNTTDGAETTALGPNPPSIIPNDSATGPCTGTNAIPLYTS